MAKKEKNKKKKKSIFPAFIIVVLIIVILLMLYLKGGFGGGSGDDSGDGDTVSAVSSVVDSVADVSEAEKRVEKVIVSGSEYSYGGTKYTLDDLKSALESKENIVVEIQDDGAVANAIDGLHSMLDDLGISYSETAAE